MPWSQLVKRMREFVLAVQAIWDCWHNGTRLSFEGDFTHRLMTPMFVPEPQPYGTPKILVAAVGELMTEMCGEVTDGMIAHAFTTALLRRGDDPGAAARAGKSGRGRGDVQMFWSGVRRHRNGRGGDGSGRRGTRKQIAFYASTPAYLPQVLELHGWGELQTDLHRLSLGARWDAMADPDRRWIVRDLRRGRPRRQTGRRVDAALRRHHRPGDGGVARRDAGGDRSCLPRRGAQRRLTACVKPARLRTR